MVKVYIFIAVSGLIIACSATHSLHRQAVVGSPCEYRRIDGIAQILSIKVAPGGDNNCAHDPVEVIFNFIPDAGAAYRFPGVGDTGQTLLMSGGTNPSRGYILRKGIMLGSNHRCVRMEITRGTCTPVIFEFPDINFADYADDCW